MRRIATVGIAKLMESTTTTADRSARCKSRPPSGEPTNTAVLLPAEKSALTTWGYRHPAY
jgi:hypothetical protein